MPDKNHEQNGQAAQGVQTLCPVVAAASHPFILTRVNRTGADLAARSSRSRYVPELSDEASKRTS